MLWKLRKLQLRWQWTKNISRFWQDMTWKDDGRKHLEILSPTYAVAPRGLRVAACGLAAPWCCEEPFLSPEKFDVERFPIPRWWILTTWRIEIGVSQKIAKPMLWPFPWRNQLHILGFFRDLKKAQVGSQGELLWLVLSEWKLLWYLLKHCWLVTQK